MSELWRACEFLPEYEPSHEQFVHLIKVWFEATVERMTGSGRLEAWASHDENAECKDWERCADPRDIALGLEALFNISESFSEHQGLRSFGVCIYWRTR